MQKVVLANKERDIPSSWNELSRPQLITLSFLLATEKQFATLLYRVLWCVSGLSRFRFFKVTRIESYCAIHHLKIFVEAESDLSKDVLQSFRLPVFKQSLWPTKGVRYVGPSSVDKSFLSMEEFVAADTYFLRYCKTANTLWLDKLIAVMYRPEKPGKSAQGSDTRIPFVAELLQEEAKKMSRLHIGIKYAVLFFYRGIRRFYQKQFPYVFSADGKKMQNDLQVYGWLAVMDGLAAHDPIKVEQMGKLSAYAVLTSLDIALIENEELKKRLTDGHHQH